MATFIKFLCVLFVLNVVGKGNCQCTLSQVTIKQSKTGEVVQQKPVWSVTINNGCPCSQSDLKLSCNGFQTVKPVDPSVLSQSDNECLVNNGLPVQPSSSVSFTYAWDTSFSFQPLSSQINCS
ncbi:TPD1 protein homolog 1-like [Castanea sativa]|uniref:TPD1 protein homolog 1-like n=1 Tax=Castanea sativa TaxID=21020 RepID=UPI003F65125F